jgi:hypothetical protein
LDAFGAGSSVLLQDDEVDVRFLLACTALYFSSALLLVPQQEAMKGS